MHRSARSKISHDSAKNAENGGDGDRILSSSETEIVGFQNETTVAAQSCLEMIVAKGRGGDLERSLFMYLKGLCLTMSRNYWGARQKSKLPQRHQT